MPAYSTTRSSEPLLALNDFENFTLFPIVQSQHFVSMMCDSTVPLAQSIAFYA